MTDPLSLLSEALKAQALTLKASLQKIAARQRPKDIHQARVASRHLRESLALTARLGVPAQPLLRRVKRLQRALSSQRTLDSLLSLLCELSLPDSNAAQRKLTRRLNKQRARAVLEATRELAQQKLRQLPRAIKRLARRLTSLLPPQRLTPVVISALLQERLGDLNAHLDALPEDPDIAALHRARILIKQLRYSWELVAPLLPAEPLDVLAPLQEAQELGGRFHDQELLYLAAVALRGERPRSRGLALLTAQLAALAEESRARFLSVLRNLQGKDPRQPPHLANGVSSS